MHINEKIFYCCCYSQAKSSRNLKYKDFFDAVDHEPDEADDLSDGDYDSTDENKEAGDQETDEGEEDYDGEEEGDDE